MAPRPGQLLLLLLLLLPPPAVYRGALGEAHLRNRRGILELAGAIRCTTGRSPFAYLRYGCYCGLGGRGWPKDRVDWCCFNHDCCYGKAERAGCHPKIESYHWECEDNIAVCGEWTVTFFGFSFTCTDCLMDFIERHLTPKSLFCLPSFCNLFAG
uniref:Phospholipase A2 n=1 Tax=Anser cygnoides TaxID=8845 RepID=A0A8B9ELT8_ANSCY